MKKRSAGFTLTELLIVFFIIAVMSAISFASLQGGRKTLALQRSAYKLAQDIRRAQEMAMSSAKCPAGTGCADQVPRRYGIYIAQPNINPTSYILFADNEEDGLWHPGGGLPPRDEQLEELFFEEKVYLSDVCCASDCAGWPVPGQRRIHITFKPPDPITEIRVGGPPPAGTSYSCSQITLTLRVDTSGPTKTVRVNKAGLIYVE